MSLYECTTVANFSTWATFKSVSYANVVCAARDMTKWVSMPHSFSNSSNRTP